MKHRNSVETAADKLGFSIPTVYELMKTGKLRYFKVGRATRISSRAIFDCIELLERESAGLLTKEQAARPIRDAA